MSKNAKLKKAGKITVIVIAGLALLFILLPFFDSSSTAADKNGKKAAPQIFTSNPLTDLVKKIYALVRGEKTPNAEQTQAFYAQNPSNTDVGQDARYDAQYEESEQNASAAGSASVPVSYDGYEEAGMINEDGEWVLVRQTAPDAAQRGMHEINTSDTAYDKLVRLERAAKYTGHTNQTKSQYPDSKWARLWNPIKNLFGGDSSAKAKDQDEPMPAMLASAKGTDEGSSRAGAPERFRRANLPGSLGRANLPWNSSEGSAGDFFNLFSPDLALNSVLDGLKSMAEKDLTKDQNKQFVKEIDRMGAQQREAIKQQMQKQIEEDAQRDPQQDLFVLAAKKCTGGASGLYNKANETECTTTPKEEDFIDTTTKEQKAKEEQDIQRAQENSLQKFSKLAGIPLKPEDFNMLVILGKADKLPEAETFSRAYAQEIFSDNPQKQQEIQRQDETLYGFYEYIFEKQGCGQSGNCFWVGADAQNMPDKTMPNTIRSAGMNYEGDPLGLGREFIAAYQQERLGQAETQEEKQAAQHIAQDLAQYPPYYLPYNQENMQEVYGRNNVNWNDPKKPENPILTYIPTAGNTKEVLGNDGWDSPATVFYGGEALDQSHEESAPERGAKLNEQVITQVRGRVGIILNSSAELQRYGLTRLLQQHTQNATDSLAVDATPDEILGR